MAVRRVMDMTEAELRELVAEIAAETYQKATLQDRVEAQMAHLDPQYRTPELRQYIEAMLTDKSTYDPDHDPTIGMFDFGPDYASLTEEILVNE